jgi:SAM-dependent methyltransferase
MEEKIATSALDGVADFFSSRLAIHGNTPRGVEWNGDASQIIRFDQVSKIITSEGGFSLNDLGCGYGAYYDYLSEKYQDVTYFGSDISAPMISAATERHQQYKNVRYAVSANPSQIADYSVASGIFNLRLNCPDAEWEEYIFTTLDELDRKSKRGFSFNCLTSYSDMDKKKDELYYADPCKIFDYCKRKYSRNVALLHDYGIYDFTVLVRKDI